MEQTKKKTSFGLILGLLLLLVILPGGSWFYLQRGYNHRKAALAELKEIGVAGAFEGRDQNGNVVSQEFLRKRVTVAGFLPDDDRQRKTWISRLGTIHAQFDDRNDVCFLLFADSAAVPDPLAFSLENGLTDSLQWAIVPAEKDEVMQLLHLPDLQHLALADTAAMVRRHYDILDNAQMGRMIEHITILMPRLPDPDIEFRRDKEK